MPRATLPTKRSGMRKSTRISERSSRVATSVAVPTWSPSSTPRMPTKPSNGARITRRSSASSASRSSSSAWRTASSDSSSCTSLTARELTSRSLRSTVVRASSSTSRARSSAMLSASASSRTIGWPVAHEVARRHLDRGHPPGNVGRQRHRAGGAAVADRRHRVRRCAPRPPRRRGRRGRRPAARGRSRPPRGRRPCRPESRRARAAPPPPADAAPRRARPPPAPGARALACFQSLTSLESSCAGCAAASRAAGYRPARGANKRKGPKGRPITKVLTAPRCLAYDDLNVPTRGFRRPPDDWSRPGAASRCPGRMRKNLIGIRFGGIIRASGEIAALLQHWLRP